MRERDLNLSRYNISKNRYRELLYFCRQYPEWKDELKYNTETVKSPALTGMPRGGKTKSQTEELATRRAELSQNCQLIEQTAIETDAEIYQYILKNVTTGAGYNYLRTVMGIPMGINQFYECRRHFFYLLDKKKNR